MCARSGQPVGTVPRSSRPFSAFATPGLVNPHASLGQCTRIAPPARSTSHSCGGVCNIATHVNEGGAPSFGSARAANNAVKLPVIRVADGGRATLPSRTASTTQTNAATGMNPLGTRPARAAGPTVGPHETRDTTFATRVTGAGPVHPDKTSASGITAATNARCHDRRIRCACCACCACCDRDSISSRTNASSETLGRRMNRFTDRTRAKLAA